jgi:hypothetical protein
MERRRSSRMRQYNIRHIRPTWLVLLGMEESPISANIDPDKRQLAPDYLGFPPTKPAIDTI